MQCAKCSTELKERRIEEVKLDVCPKCSGIWFDFDELQNFLDKDYKEVLQNIVDNNQGHDELRAACPKCGGKGKMINIVDPEHDIHIDTCLLCYGIWLDGGEYELLKNTGFFNKLKSFWRKK
ncbi:MAG: zf-TFIIB domain-containing protein [Lentisphaerae bacterium]|nr:zf-TFIIB domain-containing protein [Lentisphaerota bacterium]MCP4101570.1 zf-TFIIB domain-containing protein [Lentisphaerota bacterium]